MTLRIRPYTPADREALVEVCVRTARAGEDARGHLDTPELYAEIWALPYVELEPDLAFVLDDGARVVGYVLGTADTARWVREHRERWLPRVGPRHPRDRAPAGTREHDLLDLLHHPEHNLHPGLEGHPAHLHVDVLPEHQGAGHGRALIRAFVAALAARGVPGVHLGVDPRNTGARAFYDRLGFAELPLTVPGVVYLCRRTDVPV